MDVLRADLQAATLFGADPIMQQPGMVPFLRGIGFPAAGKAGEARRPRDPDQRGQVCLSVSGFF